MNDEPQEPTSTHVENGYPQPEYSVNLQDLVDKPTQQHIWVERGAIISCENAGHPNHRHYKVQPKA